MRRSALQRKTSLRARPRHLELVDEPARTIWKLPISGYCTCGCSEFAPHLERHHVVTAETVKREHGDLWNLDNSMLLHPLCHARHTSAFRKIRAEAVPIVAVEYAIDLLGPGRAEDYFERMYS